MQSEAQIGSLSEKFDGFGAAPTDALWGNIEAALVVKEKKRRGIIWWWFGGASAAAIILVVIMLLPFGSGSDENTLPIVGQKCMDETTLKKDNEPILVDDNNNTNQSNPMENNFESENEIIQHHASTEVSFLENDNRPIENVEFEEREKNLLVEQKALQEDVVLSDIAFMEGTKLYRLDTDCAYPILTNDKILPKQNNSPWEFGFNVGYWTAPGNFGKAKELTDTSSTVGSLNTNNGTNLDYTESINGSPGPLTNGSVKKNLNITAFVGKYINERWSWRAGLDYTRTSFQSNYYTESSIQNIVQSSASASVTVTAIGLPISLQYDFIKRSKYKLRCGITMVNEFPVHQKFQSSSLSTLNESKKFTGGYMGGWQLGLSSDVKVGKNLFLSMTPAYKFYSTQWIKSDVPLAKKRHWIGGTIGLTWQL